MSVTIHDGWRCDACGALPILGWRYKCGNCVDFDLCSQCFLSESAPHDSNHVFLVMKKAIPAVPGTQPVLNRILYHPNPQQQEQQRIQQPSSFNPQFSSSSPLNVNLSTFSTGMIEKLMSSQGELSNVVFSPASAVTALSLALLGASDSVLNESVPVLLGEQAKPLSVTEQKNLCGEFIAVVNRSGRSAGFQVANSLWVSPALKPAMNQVFIQELSQVHGCDVFNENLSAAILNDWVSKKTEGEIPRLLDQDLLLDGLAVIINCVYFNGKWRHPFDHNLTRPATFFANADRHQALKQVDMMMLKDGPKNLNRLDTHALVNGVELPYRDSGLVMRVAVPKLNSVDALHAALDAVSNIRSEWNSFGECAVFLPRFRIEFGPTSLKSAMQSLGIRTFFDDGHHFPLMASMPLKIDEVIQACVLDVDEDGTVAAAATAVIMAFGSAPRQQPFTVRADCPFAISLYDPIKGILLFSSVIVDPKSKKA